MTLAHRLTALLAAALAALTLAACGGGGGSPPPPAPVITVQPADLTVTLGQPATFTVVATGTALSYQWQRNGVDIPGATGPSYTTPPTVPADSGVVIKVIVTNPGGSVSAQAFLYVQPPPVAIDVQPASQTVLVGQAATFSVSASGSGLSYQWQLGGVDLPGATGESYTTPPATLDHGGRVYRVIVSNLFGTVTSDPATLTVEPLVAPVRATPWVEGTGGGGVALRADGTVWAWGDGALGQLGQGHTQGSLSPVLVRDPSGAGALDRVVKISGGATHVLALRDDGTVWAWGQSTLGATDTNEQLATLPVQVAGIDGAGFLSNVVDVSAGLGVSAAVLADGTVVAWGDNSTGAVGVGTNASGAYVPSMVRFPALVAGATGVVQVSAGYRRVLARRADGAILSWGHNPLGELGRVTGDTATPGQVAGISSAVRVTAGFQTTTAILADGTARVWGRHGYLGGSDVGLTCSEPITSTPVPVPLPAGGGSSFAAVVPTFTSVLLAHGGRLLQSGRLLDQDNFSTCASGLLEEPTSAGVVGVARSWGWYGFTWDVAGRVHGFGQNPLGALGLGHADDPGPGLHELPGLNLLDATPPGQEVFFTDFEPGVPAEVAAGTGAERVGVQQFAGLGPAAEPFAGSFLRSATGNVVTVTLTGLPAHRFISLGFLFAAIDSLDGAGTYPAGDYFKITLDGATLFREAFANAGTLQVQTYLPPPGVELARHVDLGFTGPGSYYTDSAYDLAADPRFQLLPHTGDTATFTFQVEGEGIQGLGDESWAMDNLRITVHP
jgi:hypothetical protein